VLVRGPVLVLAEKRRDHAMTTKPGVTVDV
jgi:hypothetical protein